MEEENLDTISFKEFNEAVYSNFEELNNCWREYFFPDGFETNIWWRSRVWDEVDDGMDAWYLRVFSKDTVYKIPSKWFDFSMTYTFSENFMLPLSHDE
jgi:1,4-alpha-glucan branching enzyme